MQQNWYDLIRQVGKQCHHLLPDPCQQTWQKAIERGWQPHAQPYCHRCGASIHPTGVTEAGCAFCLNQRLPWRQLIRIGEYAPPLSSWIVRMKFHQQWQWCKHMGITLADQLPESLASCSSLVVCPVPMHWRRRCHRGFNQADLIARSLAKKYRWPVVSLLRRIRHTPPQTQVTRSQRHLNVRHSVGQRRLDLAGWAVLLVDDVKTTGSTLRACCRILKKMRADAIHIAVVAVADPKSQHFKRI